ncbi:MAG: response regulator [Sandaracinaceae bacterium]
MAEPPLSGLEAHLAKVKERARARLVDRATALDAAATSVDDGDPEGRETVLRLAHKLRGIGGSIGRDDLTDRAGRLEDAIRADAGQTAIAEGARRLARACREPRQSVTARAPQALAASPLNWRVLVIDDAPATGQLLALTLRAVGCDVEPTDDPEVFLRLARERRPDLVIVDAMMPRTNGLTLHGQIRSLAGPPIPVVILSAASAADLGWELPDDPKLQWMRKPFRRGPLIAALSRFVGADAP